MSARKPRTSEAVKRGTGRDRDEWFALLDDWGAGRRRYREIADWLTGEHHVSRWWAQKLIVEYEQERGLRPPGVRPDATFEVSASKTIEVPLGRLFGAFVNARQRQKWLKNGRMSLRTSQRDRSARFNWEDGSTRVSVGFSRGGPTKSTVWVAHERLPDADKAKTMKSMWKDRLGQLKSFLESTRPSRRTPNVPRRRAGRSGLEDSPARR